MQTKEKKRKNYDMHRQARRCSYCTIFALSTSLIIKNIEKSLREP